MSLIKLQSVSKYYKSEETVSVGMKKISLEFDLGEFVAVTGESGSGKSTLLNVISGLDGYEDGELYLFDDETSHYTISDWERYRGAYIGFVFQNYNIIDSYTVLQNVLLALEVQGYDAKKRKQRALELIDQVGLTSHKHHKASKLSGGQKQRAVIARALAKDCPIIVADEPTGNLDSVSGEQVLKLLHEISKNKLIIVVTHDYEQIQAYATRKIKMHDGEVVEDKKIKHADIITKVNDVKLKKMPFHTLLRFALRNLLSTPKKLFFLMLMQILVIGVFTIVYTDRISAIRETGLQQSQSFPNVPETRVLVEKRDGSPFTESELNYFRNHPNVNRIHENSFRFYNDSRLFLRGDTSFSYVTVRGTDTEKSLSSQDLDGSRPVLENEIVVGDQYTSFVMGESVTLFIDSTSSSIGTFKIVGFDKLERGIVYFSEAYLAKEALPGELIDYKAYAIAYNIISDSLSFNVGPDRFNIYQQWENNPIVDLFIEGPSTTTRSTTTNQTIDISAQVPQSGFLTITYNNISISSPSENYGYALLRTNIYSTIVAQFMAQISDYYQMEEVNIISLSVDGYYAGNKIIEDADIELYKVYYPANISSALREFLVFFLGLIAIVFLTIFGLFLYSIVHAVSKNVMNARKKDFAIFRSIGTNQKTLAKLVIVEQVMMSTTGFVITLLLMNILANNLLFLRNTVQYMETQDYFILLILFMSFGAWLGLRFNKKVFKQSVIETLSSSKGE